jgi:hypothetical protein
MPLRLLLASSVALLLVFGIVAATTGHTQTPPIPARSLVGLTAPAPPVLSTENKLQFQVILQRLEIAKLHYEAAQQDFAAAQRDAAALVDKTKVAGYDLDLQTFTYTPLPKK